MWNKEDLKDFQVSGRNLQLIMEGFGSFTLLASTILVEEGIAQPDAAGMAVIEPEKWYPLDLWVRVFERIHSEFGDFTVRQVGLHILKRAAVPPQIVDVFTTMQFMDAGYHLNHGIRGEPMFNPLTGEMKDGIGHYRAIPGAPGTKKASCEVDSPYPCPFDEGLLAASTQKFQPSATVTHDKGGCRSRGAKSCIYHVAWK